MHVHYRNCSSPLKKLTVKKVLCDVPYLLCLSDFHIKYMQVGTEKMLLFFYLAALCIQLGLWLKLGFFASPCISTSRTNYSFCLHLPFQCACAGATKYSLENLVV